MRTRVQYVLSLATGGRLNGHPINGLPAALETNGLQRALTHREEECRRWASTAIEDALACARVPGGTGWDNGQRGE